MKTLTRVLAGLVLVTFSSGLAMAIPEPDQPIPGKVGIVKAGKLAKFVAKPASTFPLPDPSNNPVTAGATIRFFDTVSHPSGDFTFNLPAGAAWTALGGGAKGYKYKGAGVPGDPCKVVIVKPKVIKAVCKGTDVGFTLPFSGDLGVILTVGNEKRYCLDFGGTAKGDPTKIFKRKDAGAPATCPGAAPVATPTNTVAATATPTATPGAPGCGDSVVSPPEQCDGSNLGICPAGASCFPPGDPHQCQCQPASCAAIDVNSGGAHTSGTFVVASVGAPQAGALYCGGLSAANAFGPCTTDADCGGTMGQCIATPWLGVSTFAPFPLLAVSTTFNADPPDALCVHQATVPCVGSSDPCPGTPKLGSGNSCCTTPGFQVAPYLIPALGFCSRVDQTACGGGVVDTSVPALGDNDIAKVADTTTPAGPNCTYNGTETHPACGATEDKLGQIKTTIGNGAFDTNGGNTRFNIPQRSTTWIELSSPPCGGASTFDGSDLLITSFNLQLATTTASATAQFNDTNGDGVSFCGFGPGTFNGVAHGKPDLPGAGSLTVAVGAALSGGGPTYDLLFSSITPLTSPVLVASKPSCSPLPPGCPE